jgi:hypothetical protein
VSNANAKSSTYLIAQGLHRCEHCSQLTPVLGVILPVGHETLMVETDDAPAMPGGEVWESIDADANLFYVEYLSAAVEHRLRQFSVHYHPDYSATMNSFYWMNHCAFCGAQLGDSELYCEPEGAFMPVSPDAAATIRVCEVLEPIEVRAMGHAYATEFAEYMVREAALTRTSPSG